MTKRKGIPERKRRARNKKRKTQRMRRIKRYAPILRAIERYVGDLCNERFCVYEFVKKDTYCAFRFDGFRHIQRYDLFNELIGVLRSKCDDEYLLLHTRYEPENWWIIQVSTVPGYRYRYLNASALPASTPRTVPDATWWSPLHSIIQV